VQLFGQRGMQNRQRSLAGDPAAGGGLTCSGAARAPVALLGTASHQGAPLMSAIAAAPPHPALRPGTEPDSVEVSVADGVQLARQLGVEDSE
jgi:hypothetical protein